MLGFQRIRSQIFKIMTEHTKSDKQMAIRLNSYLRYITLTQMQLQ